MTVRRHWLVQRFVEDLDRRALYVYGSQQASYWVLYMAMTEAGLAKRGRNSLVLREWVYQLDMEDQRRVVDWARACCAAGALAHPVAPWQTCRDIAASLAPSCPVRPPR